MRASGGRPSPRPGFFPEALVSTAILWPHGRVGIYLSTRHNQLPRSSAGGGMAPLVYDAGATLAAGKAASIVLGGWSSPPLQSAVRKGADSEWCVWRARLFAIADNGADMSTDVVTDMVQSVSSREERALTSPADNGPGDRMGGIASRGRTCEGRWPGGRWVMSRAFVDPVGSTRRLRSGMDERGRRRKRFAGRLLVSCAR